MPHRRKGKSKIAGETHVDSKAAEMTPADQKGKMLTWDKYNVPLSFQLSQILERQLPGLHQHMDNGCKTLGHDAIVEDVRADVVPGNDYWTQVLAIAALKYLDTNQCCKNAEAKDIGSTNAAGGSSPGPAGGSSPGSAGGLAVGSADGLAVGSADGLAVGSTGASTGDSAGGLAGGSAASVK